MPTTKITKSQYESLASLRHELRRFLNFSQVAARQAGLTPQQHQKVIERLSTIQLQELRQFGPALHRLVGSITEA